MTLRVLGALVGNIHTQPSARVKYGLLFAALARQNEVVDVHDVTLRGLPRVLNALSVFHPRWPRWRQNFYHNIPAFSERSRQFARQLRRWPGIDVILQEGVLFDATGNGVPTVIYTDYTDRLLQRQARVGRLYLSPAEHERWIALEQQAYQRAAHICTRSALVRDSIIHDYGLPPERVSAIGGGVNFETLPALSPRALTAAPTALFIGKELHRKGGDVLLRAFARARARVPEARLLLLTGEALPPDVPTAGVEVIAPTWERAAIAALYQRADVFVLPSRLETWGDVLLEAMAFGLPGIGAAGQAMEEIIETERTGLIVPGGDEEALAEALGRLFTDTPLRHALGQAARRAVEERYTWERVAERLTSVLMRASRPLPVE